MAYWVNLDPVDDAERDSVREGVIETVDLMYNLSAADKAALVPYLRIRNVTGSGETIGEPLTNQFYATPQFGQGISEQFGDRPMASIESVTIKTGIETGWKIVRKLVINVVAHRPDAVFGSRYDQENPTVLQQLLSRDNNLVLDYGWTGPNDNMLLGAPVRQTDSVRFAVTTYNFNFTPDGQLKFQINAIENGESASRTTTVWDQPEFDSDAGDEVQTINGKFKRMSDLIKQFSVQRSWDVVDASGKSLPKFNEAMISLSDLFDLLFAEPLTQLANKSGYDTLDLEFGVFNSLCPNTTAQYGCRSYNDMAIGEFEVPIREVQKILGQHTDKSWTIDVVMQLMLIFVMPQNTWEDSRTTEYQVPEITVRTVMNPLNRTMLMQVIDRKRYISFSGYTANERNISKGIKIDMKENLPAFLERTGIPKIDIYHQASFLQSTHFSVTMDDQMASMFIRNSINQNSTRAAMTTVDGRVLKNLPMASQMAMLYRSAIKGDITMLGNFCWNPFDYVWMNFGVWAYDGLFYVVEKNDSIDRNGFLTKLTLQAEGSDPLNVGGAEGYTAQDQLGIPLTD